MNFSEWFATWLGTHPLHQPKPQDPVRYTAQVMERVKALGQPGGVRHFPGMGWRIWQYASLSAAVMAAGVLLVLAGTQAPSGHLARAVIQDAQLLDELTGSPNEIAAAGDAEALAGEMELLDAMVLAEAPPTDEQWVEQTLQILDQADDEGAHADDSSRSSDDDELLDELLLFDEDELLVRS